MRWYAPDVEVTVGSVTRRASVNRLEVVAARGQPVTSALLELSNVRFEWDAGAKDGDCLVIKWGPRGSVLQPIFDGTVKHAEVREVFHLTGLCRSRRLADTKLTRTYRDETLDAAVKHMVGSLGFASLDLDPCSTVVDKLPLHNDSIVTALELLNRRFALNRAYWTDPRGGFHWKDIDEAQAAVARFTHGVDIQNWQLLPGDRRLLTVAGCSIWHSQVVDVVERTGTAKRYFVDQVKHSLGGSAGGLVSNLWLWEIV